MVWFGPTKTWGQKALSSPRFCRPACTVTTPARLARMSGAVSIFLDSTATIMVSIRFHLSRCPMITRVRMKSKMRAYFNRRIEDALKKHPSQYMWMHKRFKTNPDLTRQTLYQFDHPLHHIRCVEIRHLSCRALRICDVSATGPTTPGFVGPYNASIGIRNASAICARPVSTVQPLRGHLKSQTQRHSTRLDFKQRDRQALGYCRNGFELRITANRQHNVREF